ncbi:uncharacterized protein BDZ99DRAFT_564944 [Mytilinidion resinicola]|uniref:Uncharacterized protein n=1 Tax=Mytilinidion resinicola TaxID=574789 RepID=A0A6A6Z8U4_9PEZI|nr:uncharacterized protein BDZ99DRAFT_564944 [Mytilinidion resinicola]KAF2817153.1 hypothetical protein BDZ99DRAFT_564944 [Mytilinidion resinicola]
MAPFPLEYIDPQLLALQPSNPLLIKESIESLFAGADPEVQPVPTPIAGSKRRTSADDNETDTGFVGPRNSSKPAPKRQKREEPNTELYGIKALPQKSQQSAKPKATGAKDVGNCGRSRIYDYMKSAPHKDHSLNLNISVTAVELIVLIPHSILSWPIANRLVQNGMTYKLHKYIARRHRAGSVLDGSASIDEIAAEDDKLYSVNSILHGYQHAMRAGPDPKNPMANWTHSRHSMLVSNNNFDPKNVSLSGVRTRAETHSKTYRPPKSIPLESLANDVLQLPQGADAADLTRAVEFAQQYPGRYFFPTDVEAVIRQVGRVVVTREHTDAACIRRWMPRMQRFRDEAIRLRCEALKPRRNAPKTNAKMSPLPINEEQYGPAQNSTGSSLVPTIDLSESQDQSPVLEAQTTPEIFQEWIPEGEIAPDITETQAFPEYPTLLRDAPDPNQGDRSFRALCIKVAKHPYFWHLDWPDSSEGLDMVLEYMRDHPAP